MTSTLQIMRSDPFPTQVVELDERRNMIGTEGTIDVWEACVPHIFRDPAVMLEAKQWNGTKLFSIRRQWSRSGDGQWAGISLPAKGHRTISLSGKETGTGAPAEIETGLVERAVSEISLIAADEAMFAMEVLKWAMLPIFSLYDVDFCDVRSGMRRWQGRVLPVQ